MPAGRPKGAPNRPRAVLIALLKDKYPDYNPVFSMIDIANDPENDIALRASMHKEVAGYIAPKLKSVEVTGQLDTNIVYKPLIKRLDGSVDNEECDVEEEGKGLDA